MGKSENNTIKQIRESFAQCTEKIDAHIRELKIISSEEILNGSIEEAQKILNNILPVEVSAKKMMQYQDEFLKIIDSVNIGMSNNSAPKKSDDSSMAATSHSNISQDFKSSDNFTTQIEFRISILKALIYLGGSASVPEAMEFIEKDMRKRFRKGDFDIPNGNGKKRWEITVKKERDVMEMDGLLNKHASNGTWEIVQKGIDYLSNHGK